jgi:hypothetical protein
MREKAAAQGQGQESVMNTGNQPHRAMDDKAADSQIYRNLARSYTQQLQKQVVRKKRMTSLAFVLCTAFFLGLIVISYLSRG